MPLVTNGEFVVGAVHWTTISSPNSQFINTFGYEATGLVGASADLVAGLDAIFNAWLTAYTALMSNDINLEKVVGSIVPAIGTTAGAFFESTTAATSMGGATAPLPYQNCALVRTLSTLVGRKGRHRSYIPGVLIANVADQKLTTVPLAAYITAATAAGNAPIPATSVVLSQCHMKFNKVTHILEEEALVTQWKADSIIRCQRRRQPDRGS